MFIWSNKQPGPQFRSSPLIGTLLNVFILRPPTTFYCNFCQRPTIVCLYFKEESNTGNFNTFCEMDAESWYSFLLFYGCFHFTVYFEFFHRAQQKFLQILYKKNNSGNFTTTHKMDGDSWYSFLLFYGLLNSRLNI